MRRAFPDILGFETPWRTYAWSAGDVMLYALALGMGADPLDPARLVFVQEAGLEVLPTFATMAAFRAGVSPAMLGASPGATAHLSQSATFHRPLTPAGRVSASSRVTGLWDRGSGRGAVLETETRLLDEAGAPVATLRRAGLLRGLGGFGGPAPAAQGQLADRGPPAKTLQIVTRPNQALLYRLCGDRNPLHADPAVARGAGFDRPILHGLATYGLIGAALLEVICDLDPTRLGELSMTFVNPVYPGETIRLDLWTGPGEVTFQAAAVERGAVVVRDGLARLAIREKRE
ncbi:MAG: MaoC-like dehydratase [Caulobacter sp.]|nr:MaoC-like dehydratase [Caulobacter sp.]